MIDVLGINEEDIESRSMGAGGEDLILARAARNKFPFSVECKNTERANVWSFYEQASSNSKDNTPVVFMTKNRKGAGLAVLKTEDFLRLVRSINDERCC